MKNYWILWEYNKCILSRLTWIVSLIIDVNSWNPQLCENREYIFIVLWEYPIIIPNLYQHSCYVRDANQGQVVDGGTSHKVFLLLILFNYLYIIVFILVNRVYRYILHPQIEAFTTFRTHACYRSPQPMVLLQLHDFVFVLSNQWQRRLYVFWA